MVKKMSGFVSVASDYGNIRGIKKDSSLGTTFNAFLGIPYAMAPLGTLRFKVRLRFDDEHACYTHGLGFV